MIVIQAYDPTWPSQFERIRSSLHDALGLFALRIDHIGSTSIPGLGAKDVIDIQITVRALADDVRDSLIKAGYTAWLSIRVDHVPRGEDNDPALWSKLFFIERPGDRRANIHVRADGNPNQRYPLLFRDYLRAHPNSAQSVELIKRELAQHLGDNKEAYYDIKDPAYDLIWDAAQEWSARVGWTP